MDISCEFLFSHLLYILYRICLANYTLQTIVVMIYLVAFLMACLYSDNLDFLFIFASWSSVIKSSVLVFAPGMGDLCL